MSKPNHIFGLQPITSLLNANPNAIKQLFVDNKRKDKRIHDLMQRAKNLCMEITMMDSHQLDKLASGGKHQGIVAHCEMPKPLKESTLNPLLEYPDHPLLFLVLDGVQDPHNLGACLRTADAAGVDAVIIPKDRAVSLTSTVVKVASGAAYTVPVISVTNLSRTMRHMQDAGVWFVGTDDASSQTVYELELTGSIAIVMGAEGSGLRRLTKELCDYLVSLPMAGSVQSLNVSVAAGVCLYEVVRQRTRDR